MVPDTPTVALVKRIDAIDEATLADVSGWTHDGHLLAHDLDVTDGVVVVEFEQEPLESVLSLPNAEFIRRTWWWSEYRLPFVRCRLYVEQARRARATDPDSTGTLLGVRWKPSASRVEIHTTMGPIAVDVDALKVRLEITDDVVTVRRRRVGRLLSFASTSGPLDAS
jgi:hypothetical protein